MHTPKVTVKGADIILHDSSERPILYLTRGEAKTLIRDLTEALERLRIDDLRGGSMITLSSKGWSKDYQYLRLDNRKWVDLSNGRCHDEDLMARWAERYTCTIDKKN